MKMKKRKLKKPSGLKNLLTNMVNDRCNILLDVCYQLYLEDTIVHSKEEYYDLVLQYVKEKENK